MATLPNRKNGNEMTVEDALNAGAGLTFEEHEEMPSGKAINAELNPFQNKVNELAHNGKTASVTLPDAQEKWARDQIRRACNNIDKGAKTRAVPLDGELVKIYFSVGPKSNRGRKPNTDK